MSKGAYKYNEVGSKCMSTSKGPLKSAQGKMSSAHGVVSKNTNNNMTQNVGNSVGVKCRGFKSGPIGEAGYTGGSTAHGKQPKGHKSDA